MKKRTLSAIVLVSILVGALLISARVFSLVILLVAILGFRELINIKYGSSEANIEFIKFIGYVSLILIVLNGVFFRIGDIILIILPILGLTIPIVFYNDSKRYNINDALYILGSILFLGFAFSSIVSLCNNNIYKCIYIFIISFVTDTYAYIGGNLIGRHLVSSISPKKTWEGSIIGSLMGTFIGTIFYYNLVGGISILGVIILSLVLTILSEIGDLVFSSIKRYFNKKDYSNLIPGHGGILDRFDSVIFVALGLLLILNIL